MDISTLIAWGLAVSWYAIMGYGVFVCVSAYKASKKKAWLLIAFFCLAPFIILAINKTTEMFQSHPRRHPIMEHNASIEEQIAVKLINYNLPVFQICLVVGLSFLAEEEIKRNNG